MLYLKPLGLQNHLLARRPLGQSEALVSLPPLGTSINTIGQTFPVLQLSLEQSERLSQNAAFVDGFTSFQNDDRIPVSSEQRRFDQSSSPRSTPSVSAPTEAQLETPVTSESFPAHLNLVSRKPLAAPEPLGGLLPLEQVSETLPSISTVQAPSPSSSSPRSEPPELLAATDSIAASPSPTVTQTIQPSIESESASPSIALPDSTEPSVHSYHADSITPPAFSTAPPATSVQLQSIDQVEPQALQQETEPFLTPVSDGFGERASENAPASDVAIDHNELQTSSAPAIPEPVSDVLSPDVSPPEIKDEQHQTAVEPIADATAASLQRSMVMPSIVSDPAIPKENTAPSLASGVQPIEAANTPVQLAQTVETTEQAENDAIALSEETITNLPSLDTTGIPSAASDTIALDSHAIQRQPTIEPVVASNSFLAETEALSDETSLQADNTNIASDSRPVQVESSPAQAEVPTLDTLQRSSEPLIQAVPDREAQSTPALTESLPAKKAPDSSTSIPAPLATPSHRISNLTIEPPLQKAVEAGSDPTLDNELIDAALNPTVHGSLQARIEPVAEQRFSVDPPSTESVSEPFLTIPTDSIAALPGLGASEPLVSPKSLLTPSFLSAEPMTEATSKTQPTLETPAKAASTDLPLGLNEGTAIARKPESSEKPTPTVQSSSVSETPDSWSSLADLLNQSTSNQSNERSWQDVVADLSGNVQTPSVQRSPASESSETAVVIAPHPSESITLFHAEASEQIAAKTVANAPTTTQGQTNDLSDEQLDELALAVYSRLRMQLESDRERHGIFTTGHQLWLGSVLSTANFANTQKNTPPMSGQQTGDDRLSPLNTKLEKLTDEVYYLLRSRIEVAHERYGDRRQVTI